MSLWNVLCIKLVTVRALGSGLPVTLRDRGSPTPRKQSIEQVKQILAIGINIEQNMTEIDLFRSKVRL